MVLESGYYAEEGWAIDPNNADTDGDGYSDSHEIDWGSDPTDPNSVPDDVDMDVLLDIGGLPDYVDQINTQNQELLQAGCPLLY